MDAVGNVDVITIRVAAPADNVVCEDELTVADGEFDVNAIVTGPAAPLRVRLVNVARPAASVVAEPLTLGPEAP
jgi:hypothetical protein